MTSNNAFAVQTCILGVVVTNESNMASSFPEAGNLNGSNADMCSDVAGPSRSGADDLFDFGSSSRSRTFAISPTTSITGCHLGFELATTPILPFRACYVIMDKVYFINSDQPRA